MKAICPGLLYLNETRNNITDQSQRGRWPGTAWRCTDRVSGSWFTELARKAQVLLPWDIRASLGTVTPQDSVESHLTEPGTSVFTRWYEKLHPHTDAPGPARMPQVRLRRK
jgi:hypothetical protein